MFRLLLVLKDYPDHKAGDRVRVECSPNGKPLEKKWRRLLKEARRDGSCEWITAKSVERRVKKLAKEEKRIARARTKVSNRMQKSKNRND